MAGGHQWREEVENDLTKSWVGDLQRFYLEKCCHEADRGPSNQTGLGMGLFFVGGGGVVGCGKVYNWYTAAPVFDTNTITCSKTSCICRASRGGLGLLLSFMTCYSNLRSFSSIQCLFHCTKQILIVTSCCCLPLLSLLHCIALQSVCAKRHLRWLEFRGQERSRGSTLCCFHLLAILLLLSLSTNYTTFRFCYFKFVPVEVLECIYV